MYILKQSFFSISVNRGFRNIYLATSRLGEIYIATIHLDFKEKLLNRLQSIIQETLVLYC